MEQVQEYNKMSCSSPHHCHHKKISWTAVFTGALIALGLSFLFNILTLGVGLTSPVRTENGMQMLAYGALIWLFIGGYIMFFIGGWVAGKIASVFIIHPIKGLIHGFLAWVIAFILGVIVLTHVAKITNITFAPNTPVILVAQENAKEPRPAMHEEVTQHAGLAALGTFFVFLAGALGSSLGGYFAITQCCRKDESTPR